MPDSSLSDALGRIPSGLFILTARHDGHETGMLASWVMQAGFAPPMVTVAVKQGRYVASWLEAGAPFVLNLVPQGDKALLKHFGRGFEPGEPAFEGLELVRSSDDVPILAAALGHLACRPKGYIDSGDHRVFMAEITSGSLASEAEPYVHVRENGLKY